MVPTPPQDERPRPDELARAARRGDAPLVRVLMERGADPRRPGGESEAELSCLSEAGLWSDWRGWMVMAMKGDTGMTPLMHAAREGHLDCVVALATPTTAMQRSGQGQSALMLALMRGHSACALHLAGMSDLEALSRAGWSARSIAVRMAELAGSARDDLAAALSALSQRSDLEGALGEGASRGAGAPRI